MSMTNATTEKSTKEVPSNRGAAGEIEKFAMANCRLMLENAAVSGASSASSEHVGLMFGCKVCGRKFKSFQALGGHGASHKKTRLQNSDEFPDERKRPAIFKKHVCKICNAEFSTGQALGGHMRKHRVVLDVAGDCKEMMMPLMADVTHVSSVTTEGSLVISDADNDSTEKKKKKNNKRKVVDNEEENKELVLELEAKKASRCKRICLDLDLNLDLMLWWKNEVVDEFVKNNCVVEDDKEDDDHK